MKKTVVVAIDSYKNSASSLEINQAVKDGLSAVHPEIDVKMISIADGGEGTLSAIQTNLGGEEITVETVDLMGRTIFAKYLMDNTTAYLEVAEVVGIDKICPSEETFIRANSFGLAALLIDAKRRGAKKIVVGLGGSGCSDGGLGLLKGLGAKTQSLSNYEDFDASRLESFDGIEIIGLADVTNVYTGTNGFSYFFGPQKGGSLALMNRLDNKAKQFASDIKKNYQIDLQEIEGSGAAGGIGGALIFLGGKIESGFHFLKEMLNLDEIIRTSDLVITGEGKMDYQTAYGKVPFGIASICQKYNVDVVAICGSLGDKLGEMDDILLASFSIQQSPISLEKAMEKERTLRNVKRISQMIGKLYFKELI
ncbi:glycerate kinase [Streptococcus uberis]|uniref:glycerate kinase family protein n=1 Tax=Streptococcus uberis TaxID=1349 RepID=UPI001FF12FF2|nr:glycerate kinase [Streptococcus uberis]MCK1160556.1 glycerate kinase [Streptococcus uberis]MCK1162346.1 glycerate kinase [Streptococcus uberis]MCK1211664.1 glycerate kinase [Streptococcus uberis]MCK1217407.1 glycerate kinase [Streptococcus uberis]MCK1222877.1 glycerate kinase [Streptococcus uberis]